MDHTYPVCLKNGDKPEKACYDLSDTGLKSPTDDWNWVSDPISDISKSNNEITQHWYEHLYNSVLQVFKFAAKDDRSSTYLLLAKGGPTSQEAYKVFIEGIAIGDEMTFKKGQVVGQQFGTTYTLVLKDAADDFKKEVDNIIKWMIKSFDSSNK